MRYLDELEEAGDIERRPGARALRPLRAESSKGFQTREIPLVGEVSAGALTVAEEHIDGWVRLPKEYTKSETSAYFLLRVRGDSMNKAQIDGGRIESGDLILVRQESIARGGEIVVALVDGETNIKRLVKGPGYYVLKPESTKDNYKAIVLTNDFRIQGVVIRVLKKGSELLSVENP